MTFSYFLFFNMSRITSWRIKKKAGEDVYNPTDLEVALPRDSRGYSTPPPPKKKKRAKKKKKTKITPSIFFKLL